MNHPQFPESWTEADFETMSWHDNTVRGIRINNPSLEGSDEEYDFDLILDITYILEWILRMNIYVWVVAPAQLTFHHVDHLHLDVHLGYKEDMDINYIEREEITTEAQQRADYHIYRWTIALHSLSGNPSRITFESPGFTQKLTGPPAYPDELDSEGE